MRKSVNSETAPPPGRINRKGQDAMKALDGLIVVLLVRATLSILYLIRELGMQAPAHKIHQALAAAGFRNPQDAGAFLTAQIADAANEADHSDKP